MKTGDIDLGRLGVLGGVPSFSERLHVGRPNIGDRASLMRRIEGVLDRNWLTNNGPCVQEFEAQLSEITGARHCIAMCNATVALEIAIRALGLRGEVILPSFTFVATAHSLQWQEITPVFCDINPATHNMDPAKVEELITPETTGIVGVHVWGRPCDTDALQEIAERRGLRLLFDAAHAFACSHDGRSIGTFGDAEVFSFHATKFLNSFEGGAVVTNNEELAEKMRLMKNFGFGGGYDNVISIGTNGKMNELSAAMGLTSLESMQTFIATNRRNYRAYRELLAAVPGLSLIEYDEEEACNYQYVVVEIDDAITGLSRDLIVEILHAENVMVRRYFHPGCHRMEPYRSRFPDAGLRLPETEKLCARILVLPTGTAVGETEIRTVCGILATAAAHGEELTRLLGAEVKQ